jgi:FAD/FMN-containing dehydrogenase
MPTTSPTPEQVQVLSDLAGPGAIINGADREPLLREWRDRWQGQSPLIVAPASTSAVAQVVAFCAENNLPIVPQGGNTGLVGGQVPQGEILVSTKRLRAIRDVDPAGSTMTVEAGVTLHEVRTAAEEVQRLFPLSIGSEGSCQLGGILSTNAGGVNVLRYGSMRDLVLGLEVVLPDGRVWSGLNALRKNNTGYDLKQLFIGAEGTLGLVTAAVLKLFPIPQESVTALVAVPSVASALDLLALAQARSGGQVAAFELMSDRTVGLVAKHFPALAPPFEATAPYYVLAEFTAGRRGALGTLVEELLAEAIEAGQVIDGVIAANTRQSGDLWALRHNASEAMKREPSYCVKCDVSVPLARLPAFLERADTAVARAAPGARVIAFGHVGDGNVHYDILGPVEGDDAHWRDRSAEMERLVHDIVMDEGGSFSAEHGIGMLKRDELGERKSAVELDLMRAVKSAIDPKGLMNPGKLLPGRGPGL